MNDSKLLFIDEAHELLGNPGDFLKMALREIDGVPNATYLVNDGKVFVFDKLVRLVRDHMDSFAYQQNPSPLSEFATDFVSKSYVSAIEAIDRWGIVPEPYELVTNEVGETTIFHKAFNARLPIICKEKRDAEKVLADILLDKIIPGDGDFIYNEQAMILTHSLFSTPIPSKPEIQSEDVDDNFYEYIPLNNVQFKPGFSPVTESLYNDVKERFIVWKKDLYNIGKYIYRNGSNIWGQIESFGLEVLNNEKYVVSDYDRDAIADLRKEFPELSMLTDGTLYELYDFYQISICYTNGWEASRGNEFLFYLIGSSFNDSLTSEDKLFIGKCVSYAFLIGQSFSESCTFALASSQYNDTLNKLSHYIESAMTFLAEDKQDKTNQGRKVRTLFDLFSDGRKYFAKRQKA